MTPAEMVTALRVLGLNATLDRLGRPAAILPSRDLAVIWPAAVPEADTGMPEPLRLSLYSYTGNNAVASWADTPYDTWTGLTADDAVTEITRHL